jgi:uncharacterized protein (DUF58 family)
MATETHARFISPQALMAIRNLEMRARIVVQGFWNGMHRSPYHGFSVEFTEYRQYSPGDDPRYLDSLPHTKAEYANTLAATLGYFLHQQGDAIGVLTFDEHIRDYLPARNRRGHLRQLMLLLEKPAAGKSTDLTAPLRRIVELVRKRGLMVFISDLLAPIETLERNIGSLVASGHEVLLFHVLDPAELKFDFAKASLFLDVESERDLYIDPAAARKDYLGKLKAHLAAAKQTCEHLGATYHLLSTDTPLEIALFDFMRSRMQRAKRVRRN